MWHSVTGALEKFTNNSMMGVSSLPINPKIKEFSLNKLSLRTLSLSKLRSMQIVEISEVTFSKIWKSCSWIVRKKPYFRRAIYPT